MEKKEKDLASQGGKKRRQSFAFRVDITGINHISAESLVLN